MTTQTLSEYELQERVGEFVENEVMHNITRLLSVLGRNNENIYCDFPHLFEGAPAWGEWTCPKCKHTWDDEPETIICHKCKETLPSRDDNFEPTEFDPIYEHWIVSPWLAIKLKERAEAVETDFYGLTVWGRSCTGHAIFLDSIIREIYQDYSK